MSLTISRILHAGYIMKCEDTHIAFDPIFENPFSKNCHAFPNVSFDHDQIKKLNLAAAFISHFHDDHCSLESLNFLNRRTPIYLYCVYEELFSFIRELGFANVYHLKVDQTVSVGPFDIIPRRALDAQVDSLFHIKAAGLNVLNVVDSWIDPSTLNLLEQNRPWDMVLWPFQTMREIEVLSPVRATAGPPELPVEWLEQLKVLHPRYIVPSSCQFQHESWSWYNHQMFPISYARFKQDIERALPSAQVIRIDPSVSFNLASTTISISPSLPWVRPVGDQDLDYDFQESLIPPSTAEVAQQFPALTSGQTELVLAYCRRDILVKYRSLEPLDYFEQPRLWRLSVFDHKGEAINFWYNLAGGHIELIQNTDLPLSWCTEVSMFKLLGALTDGETLSSMYMRINNVIFDPTTEQDLKSVDLVDDPLIRCLFNGVFGAYQAAQLRRLKKSIVRTSGS